MTTIFTSWPTLRIVQLNLNWPQNTKLCQDHTWIQKKRWSPQKEHGDICWYKIMPHKFVHQFISQLFIVAELGGQICHSIDIPDFFCIFLKAPLFLSTEHVSFVFSLSSLPQISSEYPPRYFIRFWWQRLMTSDREVSVTHRPAWEPFDKHITCSWSFFLRYGLSFRN